jgi:hypothetical protein
VRANIRAADHCFRPEADLRENTFVPSDKFAKKSSVTLWVNFSRENFHAGNPGFVNLGPLLVRSSQLACVNPPL